MQRRRPAAVPYPTLPVPGEKQPAVLAATFWCALAAMLHVSVYTAARFASNSLAVDAEPPKVRERQHVMIVREPTPDTPPRATETTLAAPRRSETEAAPPREKTVAPRRHRSPEPRRRAVTTKTTPALQSEEKRETVFRDIGVLGSLEMGATGPGGSFAVAVGTSGIDGAIGRSGRIEGVASPRATGNAAPAPVVASPRPSRPSSIRDLRRKAVPKTQHNRRIKATYPKQLREKAVSGEVRAVLLVLADGTVGGVEIVRSADAAFAASAIRVLKQFLFEPAIDEDGKAVVSKVRLTYRFLLE